MIYIMGKLLEKSHLSKVLGPLEFRVLLTSPAAYMILSLAEKASFFFLGYLKANIHSYRKISAWSYVFFFNVLELTSA